MFRKRDKPYSRSARNAPKRRRPLPPPSPEPEDSPKYRSPPPEAVVVIGLAPDASVLDLKSRFEIYGAIARIRIDGDGVGYITFRLKEAAESAVAASLDPSFGITIDSKRLQVMWATNPLCKWREGVTMARNKNDHQSKGLATSSSSKLLRGEAPLSKYGRGNKLGSAIVNSSLGSGKTSSSVLDRTFRGRGIVAYDDIL
uniref:RRM domain-containing protein n=1 Tax=Kalanchoe fedtschenkoi TaxID=63787 RepID=A0A7N0V4K3_KALFE